MEPECAGEERVDVERGGRHMSPGTEILATRPEARILIVEDEAIISFLLEELLTDAGFVVAGIAGRLETALALIESDVSDAAILDANLAGVSSGPAASALAARGIPFIVVSGYLPEQQPSAFSGARCLQKPCRPEDLIQALRDILPAR